MMHVLGLGVRRALPCAFLRAQVPQAPPLCAALRRTVSTSAAAAAQRPVVASSSTKGDALAPWLSACRVAVAALLLEPARLFGAAAQAPELDTLWARLEEVIQPSECDVYNYKADTEGDPFNDSASLWSFCYFFFNRKLKRIVCFTCLASSKRAGGDAERGDDEEEDGDFFAMEDD